MLRKISIWTTITIITSIIFCVGILVYYKNNVYSSFGKTNWYYQTDGDKGKQVIEDVFLKKMPSNAEDLRYEIKGYCGLDCVVKVSVKVDSDYFQDIVKNKSNLENMKKKPIMYQNDANFLEKIYNGYVAKPKISVDLMSLKKS